VGKSARVKSDVQVKDWIPPNVAYKKSFLVQYKPTVRNLRILVINKFQHELSGLRFGEYFPFVEFARFGIEDGVKWKLGPASDGDFSLDLPAYHCYRDL
jgi:hypothetical protein